MEIDKRDIHLALRGFLELLESADPDAQLETLELWLGQLAFLQHFVAVADDNYSALSTSSNADWKKQIAAHFPRLGREEAPAIDDLAEIAAAISECVQRWEKLGENNALWYFKFSYQTRWERRLRNLQAYLHHNLPFE